jgi:4a-hydroxytetrahydrobiopterin dehydratase
MSHRSQLDDEAIATFLRTHPGWSVEDKALVKDFAFADYGAAVGFTMRVALAAERADHHPELVLGWGRVRASWSTHDAGGITALDLAMAERSDALAKG